MNDRKFLGMGISLSREHQEQVSKTIQSAALDIVKLAEGQADFAWGVVQLEKRLEDLLREVGRLHEAASLKIERALEYNAELMKIKEAGFCPYCGEESRRHSDECPLCPL